MPIYAKSITPTAPVFRDRVTSIYSVSRDGASVEASHHSVPNSVVLCNGCNRNMAPTPEAPLYMVYLGKRELAQDRPYDCYCGGCLSEYFPKAIKVS